MLTELASREKVIGVKQSARAIRDGRAQRVFLACDADELVLEPIRSACGSLPVEEGYTMPSWAVPAGSRWEPPL